MSENITPEEAARREKLEALGFKTDDGMKDEFQGRIEKAYFDFNEKYQGGAVLMLVLEVLDFEDGEIRKVELPCGKDWDKDDPDGARAINPTNAKANFQRRSFYGQFLTLATLGTDEQHPENKLHGFDLVDHLCAVGEPPQVAAIWEGLCFEFKRLEFDFGTRTVKDQYGEETKTEMKSARLFPILHLPEGEETEQPAAKQPAAAKTTTAAPAAAKAKATPAKAKAKATTTAPAKSAAELLKEKRAAEKAAKEAEAAAAATGGEEAATGEEGPIMADIRARFPELPTFLQQAFDGCEGSHDNFLDVVIENATVAGDDDLVGYVGQPDQLFAELLDQQG